MYIIYPNSVHCFLLVNLRFLRDTTENFWERGKECLEEAGSVETPSSHRLFLPDSPLEVCTPPKCSPGASWGLRSTSPRDTWRLPGLPRRLHSVKLFWTFFKTNACFYLTLSESDFLCKTLSLFKLFKFKVICAIL